MVDLRSRSTYADFLVIASGTSDRHVQSIAESVEVTLKREKVAIVGAEGAREGQWALIDLGAVVVHVFHQFARDQYDLESIYDQAPRTRVTDEPPPPVAKPAKSAGAKAPKASKATAAKATATKAPAKKAKPKAKAKLN